MELEQLIPSKYMREYIEKQDIKISDVDKTYFIKKNPYFTECQKQFHLHRLSETTEDAILAELLRLEDAYLKQLYQDFSANDGSYVYVVIEDRTYPMETRCFSSFKDVYDYYIDTYEYESIGVDKCRVKEHVCCEEKSQYFERVTCYKGPIVKPICIAESKMLQGIRNRITPLLEIGCELSIPIPFQRGDILRFMERGDIYRIVVFEGERRYEEWEEPEKGAYYGIGFDEKGALTRYEINLTTAEPFYQSMNPPLWGKLKEVAEVLMGFGDLLILMGRYSM